MATENLSSFFKQGYHSCYNMKYNPLCRIRIQSPDGLHVDLPVSAQANICNGYFAILFLGENKVYQMYD